MQKKWCVIYTKANCEKKVAAVLTKRKIGNYCPLNRIVKYKGNKKKILFEPLFPSFVFVYIADAEMAVIRNIGSVMNFVYWLQSPVIIKDAEIENIKHFTNNYSNIERSKTAVNNNGILRIINKPTFEIKNVSKIISIKTLTCELLIPSMGYALVAETERADNDISVYGTYGTQRSTILS